VLVQSALHYLVIASWMCSSLTINVQLIGSLLNTAAEIRGAVIQCGFIPFVFFCCLRTISIHVYQLVAMYHLNGRKKKKPKFPFTQFFKVVIRNL